MPYRGRETEAEGQARIRGGASGRPLHDWARERMTPIAEKWSQCCLRDVQLEPKKQQ